MKTEQHSRIGQVITFLFILALLPLVIVAVQIQQDYRQHAANGVELYAVANSSQVTTGEEISYDIDIDTKNYLVDSVELNLTYPQDKLTISSIRADNSAFGNETEHIAGNGLIQISRGAAEPVSGKKYILTITFRALAPVSYDVLHAGENMAVKNQNQKLSTGTVVTNKALPTPTQPTIPFSFSTVLAAFFRLFGRK